MSVQDEIAKWPAKTTCSLEHTEPHRANRVLHAAIDEVRAIEARLRTADAILERVADVSCDCDVFGCEHDDARAYLAAREGER